MIRNRETPEGDGNGNRIHAHPTSPKIRNRETPKGDENELCGTIRYKVDRLEIEKPRKGTETFSAPLTIILIIIRNRETPEGDGNCFCETG